MSPNYYYSCVVDATAAFNYQCWAWIQSLLTKALISPEQIFIHYTPEVHPDFLEKLKPLKVNLRAIERLGDGKYCNKLRQLETPEFESAQCVFLLDTDMLVFQPLTELYTANTICGKVEDRAQPALQDLKAIFKHAGFSIFPEICESDCEPLPTFQNNLNGGLYVIPGNLIATLKNHWKKWALWLLDSGLLKPIHKAFCVEQVALSMASHDLGLPVKNIERKYNYPVVSDNLKLCGPLTAKPMVLHYHRNLSEVGLIELDGESDEDLNASIEEGNQIFIENFDSSIFWNFRYGRFPQLGAGFNSRGHFLLIKVRLLKDLQIPQSPAVLDVGCGDIEAVQYYGFKDYLGFDISEEALALARKKRGDLQFTRSQDDIKPRHTVLCLDVLSCQPNRESYDNLLQLLGENTFQRLIVTGYDEPPELEARNHFLKYYEPLSDSLKNLKCFSTIRKVAQYSDQVVFLAEV